MNTSKWKKNTGVMPCASSATVSTRNSKKQTTHHKVNAGGVAWQNTETNAFYYVHQMMPDETPVFDFKDDNGWSATVSLIVSDGIYNGWLACKLRKSGMMVIHRYVAPQPTGMASDIRTELQLIADKLIAFEQWMDELNTAKDTP